jgi:hypothetical protein
VTDPTYDREIIDDNPVWKTAFILSEIYNDNAPLGWGKYIPAAETLAKENEGLKPKFGRLTHAQRERLEMLAEEAAEVVQACTKILRHGYSSYNPDVPNHASNGDDLERELLDLWCVAERMMDYGDIRRLNFFDSAKRWVKKLRYTHHQPEFSHPTQEKQDDGS